MRPLVEQVMAGADPSTALRESLEPSMENAARAALEKELRGWKGRPVDIDAALHALDLLMSVRSLGGKARDTVEFLGFSAGATQVILRVAKLLRQQDRQAPMSAADARLQRMAQTTDSTGRAKGRR
jgi:hypothetical protein